MSRPDIILISASAGSGKTYSLTEKLAEALGAGIEPEEILATTFTNKAAAELQERARLKLLEKAQWEQAQRIFDGYVGTVNSVCGRLLKDFAFEAGLSPTLDVLPEGEDQDIYEKAIAAVVEKQAPDIDPVAYRFGLDQWRQEVKKISDLARTNNILPSELIPCADKSIASFRKLLPKPNPKITEQYLDKALQEAISGALEDLKDTDDKTKTTQQVIDVLKNLSLRKAPMAALPWAEWVRLAKLAPGAKSREIVSKVSAIAELHAQHPRFQRDVKDIISKLFNCAAEAMQAFADYKRKHGLIDFIDQESLCFHLLHNPEVQAALKERLKLILVDEFQDTSPIQLGIFLQLSHIAGKGIWVGDQKQSIFAFRGTDPTLMDAVIDNLITPKNLEILPHSYRSRPGLVGFTNALFARAFAAVGLPPKRVRLEPKRQDAGQPLPLNVWWLQANNNSEEAAATAAAVKDLLARAQDFPILDKVTQKVRSLRGGDVAILCRKNDKCLLVAEEIEKCGVRASLPRSGLLNQAESVLALACLRYLVDPRDSLAVAEILHLTADPSDPQKWFRGWLENSDSNPKESCPIFGALDNCRRDLLQLTSTEVLDLAFDAAGVWERVRLWENGGQRLANLEVLRGLASAYEDRCLIERSAATPAGLVTFLVSKVKGEEIDAQQEGHDEHAVQVLTYHRSKGLEWPVVILLDLNAAEKAKPFGVHVNPSAEHFDVANPLAGRWIRFWPWPYGNFSKGVGLDDAIQGCSELQWVSQQEKKELTRLLYVGMTRARDYLFLTGRKNKTTATAWLDRLIDVDGNQIISLSEEPGEQTVTVARELFKIQVSSFQPGEGEGRKIPEKVFIYELNSLKNIFPPARISPSQYEDPTITAAIAKSISLGERLPLAKNPDMARIGDVVHAFLATDDASSPQADRLNMAETLLANWQTGGIAPETLLTAGDRLWNFIKEHFGMDCYCRREWPVHLKLGNQKMSGWIDLLVEVPDGFVIIDHKSFPGPTSKWEEKALGFAPQLFLYRQAVEKATGRLVLGTYIHMPISGVMLEISAEKTSN